jgi:hypothetical protein
MKKFILAFFLLFIPGFTCFAQSFTLSDDFKSLPNGSGLFQSGSSDTLQLITWLHIANRSGKSLRVMLKKEDISLLPGSASSICWAGYCYDHEEMVSLFPLAMAPGDSASGCFGHFAPNGGRGISVVRWTFFNESDPPTPSV